MVSSIPPVSLGARSSTEIQPVSLITRTMGVDGGNCEVASAVDAIDPQALINEIAKSPQMRSFLDNSR